MKIPKTFPAWYQGNHIAADLPYCTDGRVLVRKSMLKNKAALKVLSKRTKDETVNLTPADVIEAAFTRNRREEATCDITTVFTVISDSRGIDGIAVKVTTGGAGPSVWSAWFNALPILWLRKHVQYDTIKMYRSQIVFYLGDVPTALLMAVHMPGDPPEMTGEEALAKVYGKPEPVTV